MVSFSAHCCALAVPVGILQRPLLRARRPGHDRCWRRSCWRQGRTVHRLLRRAPAPATGSRHVLGPRRRDSRSLSFLSNHVSGFMPNRVFTPVCCMNSAEQSLETCPLNRTSKLQTQTPASTARTLSRISLTCVSLPERSLASRLPVRSPHPAHRTVSQYSLTPMVRLISLDAATDHPLTTLGCFHGL